jgi:hypothetical protein
LLHKLLNLIDSFKVIRLTLGVFIAVILLGWFLISGSQTQLSSPVKSPLKFINHEKSSALAFRQVPSESRPVAHPGSPDIQSSSSFTGNRSIDFQNVAKPVSTQNTTSTLPNTTASAAIISSTRDSGSTASSFGLVSGSIGGGGGGGPIREITIPVPEGAKVPALFQDDTPKPPQQMKALDRIASEFEQNVTEIPAGMTQEEVWEAARLIADERYMTLFGYQAYNQYHIKAAKEALKEKRTGAPNTKGP